MFNIMLNPLEQMAQRFALELKLARQKSALSHKSLARMVGVSPKTVEGWEAGHLPQTPHFWRVVMVFGPDFLNAMLEPLGMGGVSLLKEKE